MTEQLYNQKLKIKRGSYFFDFKIKNFEKVKKKKQQTHMNSLTKWLF